MKKLQNNFTTPEQSKWLLMLGVPADSADCVLENLDTAENNFQSEDYTRWIIEKRHVKEDIFCERNEGIFLPCWSVGRLIEICLKCSTLEQRQVRFLCDGDDDEFSLIDYVITVLESSIMTNQIDFSKLEG